MALSLWLDARHLTRASRQTFLLALEFIVADCKRSEFVEPEVGVEVEVKLLELKLKGERYSFIHARLPHRAQWKL